MHSTNTSAQLSAKSGRPVALHRTQRQEDRRAQRRAFLHHRPAQGAGHRRPPGVALHPCDRHRAERHLRRRGRRPSRFVAPGVAYRPRRNPLDQSRTHPLARTVRCLVRRRRAGRFGRNFRISESENIPTKRYIRQRREKPPSFLCPDESRKGYLDIDR